MNILTNIFKLIYNEKPGHPQFQKGEEKQR